MGNILSKSEEPTTAHSVSPNGNLGICHERLGHYEKAIDLQERCMSVHEELGNRTDALWAAVCVGNCYEALGQHAAAVSCFEVLVQPMLRGLVQPMTRMKAHWGLGRNCLVLGEYRKAEENLRKQLTHARQLSIAHEADAMLEDAKLGARTFTAYDKIAVVTDATWLQRTVKAFGWMMPGEVRTFHVDALDEATGWISS